MEANMQKILAKADRRIKMKVFTGHFVTPHSHITRYLDMTTLKTRASEASAVAETLAQRYTMQTIVDTIVCLDNTEVIGAYLAAELTKTGIVSMNAHQTIYVIKPEIISGQNGFHRRIPGKLLPQRDLPWRQSSGYFRHLQCYHKNGRDTY